MRFSLPEESPLPRAYDVAACARCAFVYADTPGTAADYALHYAQHSRYEDAAIATGGGDRAEDRARIEELADWIAARVPADASVLDIGCGNGGLLDALQQRGFAGLAGIDPAPGCVARLRSRGFTAWQGTLDRLPAEARGFDLVVLSHVLEHVLDVHAALRDLRGRLTARGALYVETPDATRYTARRFVPFYFFDSEHINHFDDASLQALGRRAGYETSEYAGAELRVEGGLCYPVARALLRPAAVAAGTPVFDALAQAVAAYIDESRRRNGDRKLEELVASGQPLALWGAGSQAQRLLECAPLMGAKFVAVVDRDRNKQGLSFAGCRVTTPEIGLQGLPAGTVVVIAAALAARAIVAECRIMGVRCHVPGDAG